MGSEPGSPGSRCASLESSAERPSRRRTRRHRPRWCSVPVHGLHEGAGQGSAPAEPALARRMRIVDNRVMHRIRPWVRVALPSWKISDSRCFFCSRQHCPPSRRGRGDQPLGVRVLITPEWYPWPEWPASGVLVVDSQAVARLEQRGGLDLACRPNSPGAISA